jgi:hypothetical protein
MVCTFGLWLVRSLIAFAVILLLKCGRKCVALASLPVDVCTFGLVLPLVGVFPHYFHCRTATTVQPYTCRLGFIVRE